MKFLVEVHTRTCRLLSLRLSATILRMQSEQQGSSPPPPPKTTTTLTATHPPTRISAFLPLPPPLQAPFPTPPLFRGPVHFGLCQDRCGNLTVRAWLNMTAMWRLHLPLADPFQLPTDPAPKRSPDSPHAPHPVSSSQCAVYSAAKHSDLTEGMLHGPGTHSVGLNAVHPGQCGAPSRPIAVLARLCPVEGSTEPQTDSAV